MKKLILLAALVSLILSHNIFAQKQDIYKLLDKTLSYRGLSQEDITIPVDTTDRINTNQCKLILPIVYNIMRDPLSSMPFLDTVMNYKNLELQELLYTMFKDINYYESDINNNRLTRDFTYISIRYNLSAFKKAPREVINRLLTADL